MAKKDDYEVAEQIKGIVEGTANELESQLQPVELPPEISDAQIKQAIINITPEGYEGLLQRMESKGISRQEVIHFLSDFSAGRKF